MTTDIGMPGTVPVFDLVDRLRKARESAGLKQAELAELIGVSRATLASVEQRAREARRGEVIAIAFATGVDPVWLETGKTPVEIDPNGGEECAIRDSNPEPTD